LLDIILQQLLILQTTPIDPPDNSMTGADNLLQANTDPQWLQEIDVKTDQHDNCKIYITYQ